MSKNGAWIDSIGTPVMLLNDQGIIQKVNHPALLRLGYENISGQDIRDLVDSSDASVIDLAFKTLGNGTLKHIFEVRLRHQSGQDVRTRIQAATLQEEDGSTVEAVFTLDIEVPEVIDHPNSNSIQDFEQLRWLSEQGRDLLSINDWSDLLVYAGEAYLEICKPAIILVLTQVEADTLKMEAAFGLGKRGLRRFEGLTESNFLKKQFIIEDQLKEIYNKRRLTHYPGGLVDFAANHLPEVITRKVAKIFSIHDVYTIGLEGNYSVLGCVHILTQMPQQEIPVDLIEAFTFQVALALEKNKYARELRESEHRFQIIFENAPDGYYINDHKGNFLSGNLAAEQILGYPREDLIGRKIIDLGLFSKKDLPRAKQVLENSLLGKPTGPDWFPLTRSNGSQIDVEISTRPVNFDDQPVVLGIARDITQRRENEINLVGAHENLKRVLEGIDAHVYVADMESYEILYMNQRMIKDFGGDYTGQTCYEVFCAEGNKCAHCTNERLLDRAGNPGGSVIWEDMNRVTGRWYRNYDRAVFWQDQKVVRLQIAVDITDLINASKELEESELRYRLLFESSSIATMTISPPDWRFTSGNPALVALFGFDDEEDFLSCTIQDISPPYQPDGTNSQQKAMEMIRICLDQGSNNFNWIHKRKNGQEFPVIVQLTRVDLDQESFLYATVIDITDSINAERLLQEQMQNLKVLNDLNIAANQGLDLHDIFRKFSNQFKQTYQAIDTHIYLIDPGKNSLTLESLAAESGFRKIIEGYLGDVILPPVTIPLDKSPYYEELVKSSAGRIVTNSDIIKELMAELLIAALGTQAAGVKISKIISMIYKEANVHSIALVPLVSGTEIIGLVDIVSNERIPNSALGWLTTAADQLSGIIQRKRAEMERAVSIQELEVINRAFVAGSRLDDTDEICNYLADEAFRLNPDCYVMVSLLDPDLQVISVRALRGLGILTKQLTNLLGRNPQEVSINVLDTVLEEDISRRFTSGKLEEIPAGLYDLTRGTIPRNICRVIEKTLGVEKMYIIGFGLRGESRGGLTIFVKKDARIQSPGILETISNHFAEIFESRLAQREILERKRHLEVLRSVELDITSTLDLEDLLQSIAEKAAEIVGASSSGICVYNSQKNVLEYLAHTGFTNLPENRVIPVGEGLSGRVWESRETIIVENYAIWPDRLADWEAIGNCYLAAIPVCWGDESLGVLEIALPVGDKLSPVDISLLEMFAVQAAIAIKNAQLFSNERIKRQEAETLREVGLIVNSHLDRSELLDSILMALQKVVPYHSASIQLVQGDDVVIEAFRGDLNSEGVIGKRFKISENTLAGPVLVKGKNVILDDVTLVPGWIPGPETAGIHSWIAVPLEVKGNRIGLLTLDHKNIAQYQEKDAELALNFATQVAIALENSRLYEDAKDRLVKIESLRQIDLAISGSVDLEISMNVLVRQLMNSLDVDAATVLIFNDQLKTLHYVAGHGFITDSLQHTSLRLGEGLAGKAALSREIVFLDNITDQETSLNQSPQFANEKFVSYIAVPLIAKGELVGALEVLHRTVLAPDAEWFNFLNALAGQAALAIERLNLFKGLERSNLDLLKAYEATIEGWAKAIELRETETEGHSRKVVDLALRLAMRMGVHGESLLNIRRGSLLHDIGNMAIPDQILLKPDKLTDSEWTIMREHPSYAKTMLSPIDYLQNALDIPYSHHERWDGTGYPRGLKGEEIPLPARIFAIVDVWDAMQSNRPYRPALSEQDALHYIKENTGTHFDPEVVSEFLMMIRADSGN